MSKYKVGQNVRVKSDIEVGSHSSNNTDFAIEMANFRGRVVTISKIHSYDDKDYDIKEDENRFTWAEEWFEPVEEVKTQNDLEDGDVVTLRNGDRLLYSGGQFEDLTYPHRNGVCDLDDLYDDLTSRNDKDDDIIKVERPQFYYEVFNRDNEVKEMTVEEISKALGYEVKIVKEK